MLFAICAHSAPKFFPYEVKSSPSKLKALSYDGCEIPFVTGDALARRIKAADEAQMVIFSTYIPHDVRKPFPMEKLEAFMAPLKGRELVIELVLRGYPPGAPEGVEPIVKLLKEIGTRAATYQLRIAVYNHIASYCESVPFTIDIINKVDLPNVGYCFIVCHWLRLEGAKDYRPLLKANPEKLFMVTTNGSTVESKKAPIWPLDVGNFNQAQLLKTLDQIKYTGPVGLQCYNIKLPEQVHLKRSMATWKNLTTQE